jgi:hypothetical protein
VEYETIVVASAASGLFAELFGAAGSVMLNGQHNICQQDYDFDLRKNLHRYLNEKEEI